ncbi:MAG: M15 family metallopeptidase [Lachnospiraceae bacterium]|nr:M15 family metallopeptidase [Lachnospiraceae bacterium]
MMAVILFSVISSSFAFPGMQGKQTLATGNQSEWAEIQENYDYVPVELGISQNEVLDDEDVIIGYDNEELNVQDEIDQFTLDDILEANEVSRGVTEREEYGSELSIDDWQLVLVNKQHPVPEDYTFTLGTITGTMKCDVRIIDELMAMMEAAKADGIDLMICSPYRDYNRQTVLFNRKIDYYMDKGYSYLEAYKIASITVTVPGASEHQIGLALDIVSNTYTSLDTGFGKTDAGIWLREHGYEYGFILRYPLGKEYITGIQYEPWHYRYVGKKAATAIMKQGITLEEFLEDLK